MISKYFLKFNVTAEIQELFNVNPRLIYRTANWRETNGSERGIFHYL